LTIFNTLLLSKLSRGNVRHILFQHGFYSNASMTLKHI